MLARLSAFVVWALVAGGIVFWGLRLFVSPTPAPAHAVAVVDTGAVSGDLSRLFGVEQAPAVEAPPPESSRFKLLGVLAPRDAVEGASGGVALISVDGKPPRPYRAGARIEERVLLKSVSLRTASFGPEQGPVAFTLEVPRMADPATGTLSAVDPSQLQVASPPPPPPPPPVTVPDVNQMGGMPPGDMGTAPTVMAPPPRFRGGPGGPRGSAPNGGVPVADDPTQAQQR